MVETQRARAADPGAAASGSGKDLASEYTSNPAQVYDNDGLPLQRRPRAPILGAPQLAQPAWYRLTVPRWLEVAS